MHWDTERADQMFRHIKQDDVAGIGKELCTPSGLQPSSFAHERWGTTDPPISWLRPTKVATTVSAAVTSTSYTPVRPSRLRSTAVATRSSPSRVGARKRISAPAATVRRS